MLGETSSEPGTRLIREATAPAFAELRNIVTGLTSYLAAARVIALDLDHPLTVLEQVARGDAHPLDDLRLDDAISWREDLHDLVGSLASTVGRMQRALLSLEHGMSASGDTGCQLDETLEIASTIADHAVRIIGGVTWHDIPKDVTLAAPRFSVSLTIALLLRVLSEHARGHRAGIEGRVYEYVDSVELLLSIDGAPRQAYRDTIFTVGRTVEDAALRSLLDSEHGVHARWDRIAPARD